MEIFRTESWEDLPYNFSTDFIIAGAFGKQAILDTYKNCIKEYGNAYKILTRLIFDLNLLCWHFYDKGNEELAKLFGELYYEADDEFYKRYEENEDACKYHFEKLD